MKKNKEAFKTIQGKSASGHEINLTIPLIPGIHAGDKSNVKVSTKPANKTGKGRRQADTKLAKRIKAWEEAQKSAKHAQHKPGSLKCKT